MHWKSKGVNKMTQYILQLVLAEMGRIESLPLAEYRREYRELNERVRGMYGRPDHSVTIH
jgi:hypothetical protein